MTVALKFGIRDLFTEFLADALIILIALQSARTVTAGTLQSFLDCLHHFLIFIQSDSHDTTSLPDHYNPILKKVNMNALQEIRDSVF